MVAGDAPVLVHNCNIPEKHSPNALADSLDDNVFFHYTDEVGHSGIMDSAVVRADVKGRSYFTQDMVSSGDALNVLFAGNPAYAGRGTHLIAFRIDPARLRPGEQLNELIHSGSFRFSPEDVLFHGLNPFG